MTVQDGGRDDNQQQYHFQLDANTSPTSFLKYIISTYFFSGEGFLRNKAPQDQLISFSWPCISNQAALTFYPPTSGVNYQAHRLISAKNTAPPLSLNIYYTAHCWVFLCLYATSVPVPICRQISDILGTWFPKGIPLSSYQVYEASHNTLEPCFRLPLF